MNDICNFNHLETINVKISEQIAHIELCRPEKINSMAPTFWEELPAAVKEIDDNALARVIILSSTGKHFSAGIDLSFLASIEQIITGEPTRRADNMRRLILKLQDSFTILENIRIPVLSAIHGGAFGAGVDMICATDCRYATQDAFFTIKETEVGLTADVGTLQRIHHLLPSGLARELAFTSRNMYAEEALSFGFVNRVFADKETMMKEVFAIARNIAKNSPVAVAGTKEMLNFSREHTVSESLNYMATWQSGFLHFSDIKESLNARAESRLPQYDDLYVNPDLKKFE